MIRSLLRSALALGTALSGFLLPDEGSGTGGPAEPAEVPVRSAAVTWDGDDAYDVAVSGEAAVVAAPGENEGANSRVIFWRETEPVTEDHQSCATWEDDQHSGQQPGAALLVSEGPSGVRAVTVTKNVFGMHYWVFNVQTMDPGAVPYKTSLGQFELREVFFRDQALVPPPWRMCARVVDGTVSFKVWPLAEPEPAWGDPAFGGSVPLPPGWEGTGRPGWYAGHLAAGDTVWFSDLATAGG